MGKRGQIRTKLRNESDRRRIECVMFVPHTPGSILKSNLTKAEQSLNYQSRVKFVEELGTSIKHQLVRADPIPTICGRNDCFPCQSKPGNCMRQGGVYRIDCQEWKEGDITSVYFGESARALMIEGQNIGQR